ncbi:hypothetical protein MJO29_013240 [Puccinia striiformis f. sp. tritici]|nr:hypothetical protein MJO29_013240 [Puccinia striiformis f. sp. tritici]
MVLVGTQDTNSSLAFAKTSWKSVAISGEIGGHEVHHLAKIDKGESNLKFEIDIRVDYLFHLLIKDLIMLGDTLVDGRDRIIGWRRVRRDGSVICGQNRDVGRLKNGSRRNWSSIATAFTRRQLIGFRFDGVVRGFVDRRVRLLFVVSISSRSSGSLMFGVNLE